jgi:hypothetical protein
MARGPRNREFGSLLEFAAHTAILGGEVLASLHNGLEAAAALVERDARRQMGHYQPAVGPFQAWAPLSPAYAASKAAAGYPSPSPLVRSGVMLASFQHEVDHAGLTAIAGSTDPKMLWHELGTVKMAPRPVWGPAAFKSQEAIGRLIGTAAVAGLLGDRFPKVGTRAAETMDENPAAGYSFRAE